MQQEIQLNIIPFTAPVEEAEFAFYTAKQDGYCPIHKDDLNGAIEGLVDESELHYGNWLYTDFAPAKENAIIISVNLTECKYFAQHYYRHLIRTHFKGVADIMRKNFTNEIEVWLDFPRKQTPLLRTKLTPLFQVPILADQLLFSSRFG